MFVYAAGNARDSRGRAKSFSIQRLPISGVRP